MADAAKIIALAKAMGGGGGGGSGAVDDVRIDGSSIVQNGVANVPKANASTYGAVKVDDHGIIITQNGLLEIRGASENELKAGTSYWTLVRPNNAYAAAFFGLAKAAGDSTQSASSNSVGSYTESAKSAITQMISGAVSVSGTTPSIDAKPGVRYICGEVEELDITVPATGIIDVIFTSGTTPTVLTVTPPTGVTIKWANDFDPTDIEASTVYELNIMDGEFGVVGTWS